MRLITGDECGLLKECIPELSHRVRDPNAAVTPYNSMPDVTKDGVCRIDPHEKQARERGVIDMAWVDNEEEMHCQEYSFASLRRNGSIEIWKGQAEKRNQHGQYVLQRTSKNIFHDVERPSPLGLGVFQKQDRICAGDSLGNLVVLKNNDVLDVVETYHAYKGSKRGDTISYTPGKAVNTQLATAIAFDTIHGRVAMGGRERETCLVDIQTGDSVFKTKNLPPDPQTLLQQPVWPTAIEFLNQDGNTMAVGTAYKQVRLYDVRENSKMRRPTQTTPEGLLEYRVTSLCQTSDHELVVGDGAGYIYSLDLRRLGRDLKTAANKDMGRYVGPAGSVRQLKKHPTLPRLAAVGLDRMLRIYDTKKRLQLDCIYLKQRINCVLMHSDGTWDGNGSAVDVVDPEDVDIDQDDIVQEYVDSDASDEDDDGNEIEGGFNSADGSENEDASSDSENDDENTEKEEKEDERLGGVNKSEKVRERLKNTGVDKQQESNNQSDSNKNDDEEDDDDDDNESEGSSPEESMEGSDEEDEDDEVIVVQAPKRRRRH